jgi:hypothetical protein
VEIKIHENNPRTKELTITMARRINITSIAGVGEPGSDAGHITVSGTASDCEAVEVRLVTKTHTKTARAEVGTTLQAPFGWTVSWFPPLLPPLGILCGEKVKVEVSCEEDPDCKAVMETELPCHPADPEAPTPCQIEITSISGIGNPGSAPTSIRVKGTAVRCEKVAIRLTGPGYIVTGSAQVGTDPNPPFKWSHKFLPASGVALGAHCGGKIRVEAFCEADPDCKAVPVETELACMP